MWQRYIDKERGFSILLPRFWQITKGVYHTVIMAQERLKGPSDKYSENINVIVTDFEKPIPASTIFEFNKDELTRALADVYDLREGDIYAGLSAGKWFSFESKAKNIPVKVLSAIWVKGNRSYTVTCSAEVDKYRKYEPTFQKVLRSIRMK